MSDSQPLHPHVGRTTHPWRGWWTLGVAIAFLVAACSVVQIPSTPMTEHTGSPNNGILDGTLDNASPDNVSPGNVSPNKVTGEVAAPVPDVTPEVAHEFTLATLAGQPLSLRDLRGRWVIVNFWATWCGPCRHEMPYLQQIADSHAAHVTMLGINLREDAAIIRPFIDELGVTFPILMHPDDATLQWYGTRGLPLTFVVAPDGTVAYFQYGELQPEQFDQWLAVQLNEATK